MDTNTSILGSVPGVSVRDYDMEGGQLMRANHQWSKRPADERYETLDALLAATRAHRSAAVTARAHASTLRAEAIDGNVVVRGKTGQAAGLTHYAFGQICSRAGAPAGYLRKRSAKLAADAINEGLDERGEARDDDEPEALLFRRERSGLMLHAALTDSYKRVWNHEVAETLVSLRERQPQWDFPTAFKSASGTHATWGEQRKLPVAFASDHDMFVFLADQEKTINVNGAQLFRGFFVENSEVGASAFRLTMFLFDMVCCNVIVWGVRNVREISLRHVGSIREDVLGTGSKVLPVLSAYANSSAQEQQQQIVQAQRTLLADTREETISTLLGRRISGLTESAVEAAYEIVEQTPRYGDPRSVWGIVNGLTEYSQRTTFADERIALDRAAGRVMQIAF